MITYYLAIFSVTISFFLHTMENTLCIKVINNIYNTKNIHYLFNNTRIAPGKSEWVHCPFNSLCIERIIEKHQYTHKTTENNDNPVFILQHQTRSMPRYIETLKSFYQQNSLAPSELKNNFYQNIGSSFTYGPVLIDLIYIKFYSIMLIKNPPLNTEEQETSFHNNKDLFFAKLPKELNEYIQFIYEQNCPEITFSRSSNASGLYNTGIETTVKAGTPRTEGHQMTFIATPAGYYKNTPQLLHV